MSTKRPVVLIDCDGVTADFVEAYLSEVWETSRVTVLLCSAHTIP